MIGAGQAGLTRRGRLRKQGFEPGSGFVVLDADERARRGVAAPVAVADVGRTHRVHDLPGLPFAAGGDSRAADVVPAYFAEYERRFDLPVLPAGPRRRAVRRTDDDRFRVETDAGAGGRGRWSTRPAPGPARSCRATPARRRSAGRQLHTVDYRSRRGVPRAARRGRRRRRVGDPAAGRDLPRRLHDVGDPPPSGLARRPVRRGGRAAGGRPGRGGGPGGPPAGQRRGRHRPARLDAVHRGRPRARRPRAAADVRPDHAGRRRVGPTAGSSPPT